MATVLITRVAKDALEKAIEEHEVTAPEGTELMARGSEASTSAGAGASTGVRMPSPKGTLSVPFQTKSSGGKGSKQQAAQGSDLGLKDGAKGVLVRIEGSLLHSGSPKVEKGG